MMNDALLYDVMMDAYRKMAGEEIPELLFYLILKLADCYENTIREGLLSLDEVLEDEYLVKEFDKIFTMPLGVEMVTSGWDGKYVVEMLAAKYWVNNPQGIYAMANYFVIRTLAAIRFENSEIPNWYRLQELLTAYLPDGYEERYLACKDKYFPQFKEKTPKERVMQMESDFHYLEYRDGRRYFGEDFGYIVTVKDQLEKRIMETPADILRQMIETAFDKHQFSIAIKRLSPETKEKLFSCMADEAVEEICQEAVNRGAYFEETMDALTCLLLEMIEYR